ncbi:MAG: HAD family hydrolase [Eggerthellaceae bacterium]|nr:HAD family hydrolase [Eggerthellaceae bacterium]
MQHDNAKTTLECPYDAIFFDMDGTLLPIEVRDFLIPYYRLLEAASERRGWDPAKLRNAVNQGIFGMYDHPSNETNESAFWRVFYDQFLGGTSPTSDQQEEFRAFFDDFYRDDFQHAGDGVIPNPAAARALSVLNAKGYPLFLTTMPMFPYSAIEWRMQWAGCDIGLFERVTTFDNSTFTKPHLGYYEENLALADVDPSRVLMVGNNTEDDLNCLKAGMDAYLVTDYLIDPVGFDISTVKHGSLEEFASWAEGLPSCSSTHALGWRDRADALRLGSGQ